jgi:Putative MetA-pathway of phenol degradation
MWKIGTLGLAVLAWAAPYQPSFGQYGSPTYVSSGYAPYAQPTWQTPVVIQPAYSMAPAPAMTPAPQGPSQVGTHGYPATVTVPAGQQSCLPQPPSCVAPPTVPTPSTTPPTPQPITPTPQPPETPTAETAAPADIAPFGAEAGAAVGGETVGFGSPGGYLDDAIPFTHFRIRYDDQLNINRPDRAEYLYAAWKELSFHPHGILVNGVFQGVLFPTNALGPVQSSGQLNMQQLSGYLEYAVNKRLSGFVDLPVSFLHFRGVQEDAEDNSNGKTESPKELPALNEENENRNPSNTPGGLSDITFGFKYALIADPCQYLTFQYRTYAPTGDPRTGLGTGHWSLEPGLLYYKRLDRLVFQAEVEDWIPIAGDPVAGNVLTYGLGLAFDVYQRGNFKITPVTEVVGWTVLGGYESFFIPGANIPTAPGLPVPPGLVAPGMAPPGSATNSLPVDHGVISALGDTIVNIKFGVRTYFGEHSDVYVGYGRCVTGDRWYKDIYRVEYRFKF